MNPISLMIVGCTAFLLIQSASAQTLETSTPEKAPAVQSQDAKSAAIPAQPVAKTPIPAVYARSGKEIAAGQIIKARSAWLLARATKLLERGEKILKPKAE